MTVTGANGAPEELRAVDVISVAAELVGMHPQTLRNYERSGLLDPSRTRGGSRRFSDADIQLLRRIQQLTSEGHNLEGVRRILELERDLAAARHELDVLRELAVKRVEEAHRTHRRDLVPLRQAAVVWKAAPKGSSR